MDKNSTDEAAGTPNSAVGIHGMLLVGSTPMFLVNLPSFTSPHNYQVVLKVTLDQEAGRRLGRFRAHFGRDFPFTVRPEEFCITDLVNDSTTNNPQLDRFKGELIKGHFATGGDVVADDAIFQVDEVVYFRELTTTDQASANLEYLLIGSADEQLYLTHRIAGQPNFDHVVSVNVEGFQFTEKELTRQGYPTLVFADRQNIVDARLEPDERVAAQSSVGQHFHHDLQIEVVTEIHFTQDGLR